MKLSDFLLAKKENRLQRLLVEFVAIWFGNLKKSLNLNQTSAESLANQ